uniref:Helitron_like_N domain-containing protein n=1 Tax=Heligmosomoides polygyrus TaxID=6339 RepID=A0A183GNV9_HELPZ
LLTCNTAGVWVDTQAATYTTAQCETRQCPVMTCSEGEMKANPGNVAVTSLSCDGTAQWIDSQSAVYTAAQCENDDHDGLRSYAKARQEGGPHFRRILEKQFEQRKEADDAALALLPTKNARAEAGAAETGRRRSARILANEARLAEARIQVIEEHRLLRSNATPVRSIGMARDIINRPSLHSLGRMDQPCSSCAALHFQTEKVTSSDTVYNMCCNLELAARQVNSDCDSNLFADLHRLLLRVNPYAQSFVMMDEVLRTEEETAIAAGPTPHPVHMVFGQRPSDDARRYNSATANEIAVVYVGDEEGIPGKRYLDKICDPLTYPLLFRNGDDGWHPYMEKRSTSRSGRTRVTQKEFYSYLMFPRANVFNPLLHAGKLFQQYVVDSWLKIEMNRLNYVKLNQSLLRLDTIQGLTDYMIGQCSEIYCASGTLTGNADRTSLTLLTCNTAGVWVDTQAATYTTAQCETPCDQCTSLLNTGMACLSGFRCKAVLTRSTGQCPEVYCDTGLMTAGSGRTTVTQLSCNGLSQWVDPAGAVYSIAQCETGSF